MAALTVGQAAVRLACSTKTIYRLIESRAVRAFRVGRAWRIDDVDLEHYVAYSRSVPAYRPVEQVMDSVRRAPDDWVPGRKAKR